MGLIRARFINDGVIVADTPVETASIQLRLNESADWTITVPKNIYAVQDIDEGNDVEIYEDGVLLITGTVQTVGSQIAENTAVLNIKGRDRTDDLFKSRANTTAYYENVSLLLILGELLNRLDWRLGEIQTFSLKDTVTTIDLRNQETLMSQISKILSDQIGVYFRYNNVILNKPAIDIGSFNEESGVGLFSAISDSFNLRAGSGLIESLTEDVDTTEVIHACESFGGEVLDNTGALRVISLRDALVANTALATDPDFPIFEEISSRVYQVRNNSLAPSGGIITVIGNTGTTGVQYIGDVTNVEYAHAQSFFPFPGEIETIKVLFGPTAGAPVGQVTWKLHEADPGNNNRPGTVLAQGNFIPVASALNVFTMPAGIFLNPSQRYWFSFTCTNAQALDVNWRVATSTSSQSPINYICRSVNQGATWTVDLPTQTMHLIATTKRVNDGEGANIVKRFTQYAPERTNTNSTLAQIGNAGTALYNRTVAFLTDRIVTRRTLKIKAVGNGLLVPMGDSVFVNFSHAQVLRDDFRFGIEIIPDNIQGTFRCIGLSIEYSEGQTIWDFELTNSPVLTKEDLFVSIYDITKEKTPPAGAKPVFAYVPTTATLSNSQSVVLPDTTMADGRNAKLFTFTLPAIPANATNVYLAGLPYVTVSSSDMDVELVSDPDYYGSTFQCKVAPIAGWNLSSSATLEARIIWI